MSIASNKAEVIPGKWPVFSYDEIKAVDEVLSSGKVNYWTGQVGREFEKEFAAFFGANDAIAMANGTLTLEACLRALGIGEGDEVIVPSRTFLATASCVLMVGATPIFADVDLESGNLCIHSFEERISAQTKAVIPVHLGGWPCDMEAICTLAEQYKIHVIEDCAQAHGAKIRGKSVGNFGLAGSWSFCQDKIMTTGGEGGMVTTNHHEFWNDVWSVKDHGKSFDTVYQKEHPPGFRWLHESVGSNYRMTEMQSAIGREQLKKLPDWLNERKKNADFLMDSWKDCELLRIPKVPGDLTHAWYKLHVYLRPETLASDWNQMRVMEAISKQGIPGLSGSCSEIYQEKLFADLGLQPEKPLPNAKELGETSLMFLIHPGIGQEYLEKTAEVVLEVLQQAKR